MRIARGTAVMLLLLTAVLSACTEGPLLSPPTRTSASPPVPPALPSGGTSTLTVPATPTALVAKGPSTTPAEEPSATARTTGIGLDTDNGRRLAYIKRVWYDTKTSETYLTVDYAQMLTGEDAARAAEARGDESPPPNDYYIVNDNPKLRTFLLGARSDIRYLSDPGSAELTSTTTAQFLTHWRSGDVMRLKNNPYWLVVKFDRVLALEHVFLP